MKVTKKLLRKTYAFLMAFVMVIGLASSPLLTAYAEETDEVEELAGEGTWYNDDLYDSYEEANAALAEVTAENQAADIADNYLNDEGEVVDIPTFKDTDSLADYMRKCFVERRSSIQFVYKLGYTYYTVADGKMLTEDAIDEAEVKLWAETPEANEGDYLYWHVGDYTYSYKGTTQTDYVTVTVNPEYTTTAAQEAQVTQKVNSLLDTAFDGWENHTDTSNTYDVFWWLVNNFAVADSANEIYTSAYGGFISGKALHSGYASAAYRLLKEMGVNNRIVYDSTTPSVWNIVEINGKYYNFDAIYGDLIYTSTGNAGLSECYLLVGDNFMKDTDRTCFSSNKHYKDYEYRDSEFTAAHPMATEDYLSFDPKKEDTVVVTNPTVGVTYRTHVQKDGWQSWKADGAMSGTSGRGLRLEGIEIKLTGNTGLDLGIEYKTHIQKYGWEAEWKQNGKMSGTSGEAKRLEAIKIRLTGADAAKYDIYYRVHAQTYGWLGWAKNGQEAGTAGQSKRLEGIEIKIVKKGEVPSGLIGYSYIEYGKKAELNSNVTGMVNYRTHVQKYGWQGFVYDGSLSGTYGEAKRLESIEISLGDTGYTGGITYRTHIQKIGWQDWKSNGVMSGTSGQALRLEAIEIKLTGEVANHYDVYYRVHAQSYGWLDWAKNGQTSGTAGYGKRLESIQIVLLPKGSPAPGATARPYVVK